MQWASQVKFYESTNLQNLDRKSPQTIWMDTIRLEIIEKIVIFVVAWVNNTIQ